MTPQLSLGYSSGAGSGWIGQGWFVDGLSSIQRCSKTWTQDGVPRNVLLDTEDRYCLDGNRLRSVSGAHGGAGTEYRTEIETFTRVKSFGAAGSGPAYFIAEMKNGLTYEFGNSDTSRIEAQGTSTARAWMINAIRDRDGNSILFEYAEEAASGSYRLMNVQYTSNPNQGLAPAYRIDFGYEQQPAAEIDISYWAGRIFQDSIRLTNVAVKYNGTLLRRYNVTYETNLSSTSKSRVYSLQECAGSAGTDCFPATTFNYSNGSAGVNAAISTGVAESVARWVTDVNGDGRDDIVYSNGTSGSGTWMVMFASSGGYTAPVNTGITNNNYTQAIKIDYNADGLGDMLVPYSGGTWWVLQGTTIGLAAPVNTGAPVTATGFGNNARAMDVNADGLQDLVWADLIGFAGGDAIRYRLRVWGGAFSSTAGTLVGPLSVDSMIASPVWGVANAAAAREPDFNADGRDDFLYQRVERVFVDGDPSFWQHTYYSVAVATNATAFAFMTTSANVPATYGDFNGDGFTDIIYLTSATVSRIRFGTGAGFSVDAVAPHNPQGIMIAYDWDGDGKDDLLSRDSSSGAWKMIRSSGLSFQLFVTTNISSSDFMMVSDINGDGLQDLTYPSGGTWYYQLHAGVRPDLLTSVTDGFGNAVGFTYASLTEDLYLKGSGTSFPQQDYAGTMAVVRHMTLPDGIGGTYTQSYWYYSGRLHLQGRGFEGFEVRRTRDSRNGLYYYESFHQLFPYTGRLYRSLLQQPNDINPIARADYTWASQSYGSTGEVRELPYVSGSLLRRYEVGGTYNGALVSTTSTINQFYAATGTIYDSTATTTEASTANGILANTSYVSRTYYPTAYLTNSPSTWCIGRPGNTQSIKSHTDGGTQLTRTTQIDWDLSQCRPSTVTQEPGDSLLQVTQSLGYDGFGNVNSETVTGIGMAARTTMYNWGATGQFPAWTQNALSHVTNMTWDYRYGTPSTLTDPNGLVTSWLYDDFGRRTRETRPDETYTTWGIHATSGAGCDPRTRYFVVEEPYTKFGSLIVQNSVFADSFDRPINEYRGRFDGGGYDAVVRQYDVYGRLAQESIPFVAPNCQGHSLLSPTEYQYDLIGRPTQISRPVSDSDPTSQTTLIQYQGLTTRTVDALSKQSFKTTNVLGELVRSADHNGYAQNFAYDAFGNVVRVTDSLNNTLQSNTYNVRGMLRTQTDMDRGAWTFTPNALGELAWQLDANGVTTTFTYDLLGRPLTRVAPDGTQNITTTWSWGNSAANKNKGALAWIEIAGATVTTNRETYNYDTKGRLSQTIYSGGGVDYYVDRTYNDATGYLDTLTYPQSTSSYRLKLQYEYQAGRLLRVKDFNAPTTVFWQANAMDARGHVIDEQLGNGIQTISGYDQVTGLLDYLQSGPSANGTIQNLSYVWNAVGNLTYRQDVRQGLTEYFHYDDLHRLDYSKLNGTNNLVLSYDEMGNITSKAGGGTYTYHPTKKHAVIATSGNSRTFTYDNNGNQITRAGFNITWYPFNLPKQISAASDDTSTFMYNPYGRRWSQAAVLSGVSETTTYIGGLMEVVVKRGVTSYRHYISGGTGTIAEYIRDSSGLISTHYMTKDHLGSADSVTTYSGSVYVRMSYDAFGNRRNEAGWSGSVPSADMANIAADTRRGYTGHDMLDNLGLIHMNGRVYDRVAGRFISADPFIDGAGNTQGWNRYSYVHNNPLSFTDPSGYLTAPDGAESLQQSIFGQLDGGWVDPNSPSFDTIGRGSNSIDQWFNGLLSWTRIDRQEMMSTIRRYSTMAHRNVVSLPRPVPSQTHGAPMPKQQLDAAPAGGSTVGGNGTWIDFGFGALRGAADDAIRTGVLAGSFQHLFRGDFINAYMGLRYGSSAQVFGAPESNRGQFGYDVGPVLTTAVGGAGVVRSAASGGERIFYRIITSPEGEAFLSNATKGLAPRGPELTNALLHRGISVFDTLEGAASRVGILQRAGLDVLGIGELRIPAGAADVDVAKTLGRGHFTLTGSPETIQSYWFFSWFR